MCGLLDLDAYMGEIAVNDLRNELSSLIATGAIHAAKSIPDPEGLSGQRPEEPTEHHRRRHRRDHPHCLVEWVSRLIRVPP